MFPGAGYGEALERGPENWRPVVLFPRIRALAPVSIA
jgi:hypothetical protein